VFENRVLNRILGSNRDELTGEWRKLYEWLNVLYISPRMLRDKIVKNGIGGTCSAYAEGRVVYMLLVGKAEGKRPLRRRSSGWEHYNKMKFQEVGCVLGLDGARSVYGGVAGTWECGNEPSNSVKRVEYLD
jgi:hypothetical protein